MVCLTFGVWRLDDMVKRIWLLLPWVAASLACVTLFPPRPTLQWDPSPTAVVVQASDSGGMVPQTFALNSLPAGVVFGDGRIVWVEYGNSGGRRVWVAQLAAADLEAYLQTATDAGFFGWEGFYGDTNVMDASTQCLEVQLTSTSQTVCEYVSGAPAQFDTLYNLVANGLSQTGQEFVPTQGWLVAKPSATSSPTPLVWPATALGFSLAEASNGRWVEGEALALAWQVVNTNLWTNSIKDGETYYEITVQAPNLSLIPPPTAP